MTATQIAQRQIEVERAKGLARLREAIQLVAAYPGDRRAAAVYMLVSREGRK